MVNLSNFIYDTFYPFISRFFTTVGQLLAHGTNPDYNTYYGLRLGIVSILEATIYGIVFSLAFVVVFKLIRLLTERKF